MIKQETSQESGKDAPRLPARSGGPRLPIGGAGKELGIFVLLVVLCIFVTVMSGGSFLHANNLQNTSRLIGIYGIFSIGLGIVIITGGIDLSVGSLFALLGVMLSLMLTEWHWAWPLAVLATLAAGGLIGMLHGFLITRVNLQPFIVTLCGLLAYRGLARIISGDGTMGFGTAGGFEKLQVLATGSVLGVPTPFVLLIITALIMGVVLHRSVYGRYLYAVGRNEEAARYSGVNSKRVIAGAYVISAVLAGLAAILLGFYTNSISPSTHGQSYELYGIAAAVLGGCSLRGGEGSIAGILIGTALLQVLRNLVNLVTINGHSIPTSSEAVVVGAVILVGVGIDELLRRRKTTRVK